MSDSISRASDAELLTIVDQVRATLGLHSSDYPASIITMMSDFDTLRDSFNEKLNAHIAAQAAARAARVDKDTTRDDVEATIRSIRNISKAGGVDDAKMAALGIPASSSLAPATASVPAGAVDTSQRLRHTISWTDAATLDNKRRPRGSMGAEIWLKLDGPPPTDEKDCSFLTLDSATPYLAEYSGADAGKMAHYLIRWRMRDGSVGAWGETVSATITG